jgi:hypothetical protein
LPTCGLYNIGLCYFNTELLFRRERPPCRTIAAVIRPGCPVTRCSRNKRFNIAAFQPAGDTPRSGSSINSNSALFCVSAAFISGVTAPGLVQQPIHRCPPKSKLRRRGDRQDPKSPRLYPVLLDFRLLFVGFQFCWRRLLGEICVRTVRIVHFMGFERVGADGCGAVGAFVVRTGVRIVPHRPRVMRSEAVVTFGFRRACGRCGQCGRLKPAIFCTYRDVDLARAGVPEGDLDPNLSAPRRMLPQSLTPFLAITGTEEDVLPNGLTIQ